MDPARIGRGLLTHPDGHAFREAVARHRRASRRGRAIRRILRPLAGILAATRHFAVHASAAKACPIFSASVRALAGLQGRLEVHARGGIIARVRILDETREIIGHGVGAFRRIIGDSIGAFHVAIGASAEGTVERFELVASIGAIQSWIAAARASRATAAAARTTRAA